MERAPTNDLVARLDQELAVGAPGADVAFHAQRSWFEEHDRAGDFAAIKLSPTAVAEGWTDRIADRGYATVFSYPYFIAYNTSTAAPVSSVLDLVEQQSNARVGILSPAAATAVAFQYDQWLQAYGPDFLERLSQSDVRVESSITPLVQGLAAGELDYVVGMTPGKIEPLKVAGAKVEEVVPVENTAGPQYGVVALASAQHPNAAQLFVNWLATTDGQEQMIEHHSPGSVPLEVAGSMPWGEIATYSESDWPKTRWDTWLTEEWNPYYQ